MEAGGPVTSPCRRWICFLELMCLILTVILVNQNEACFIRNCPLGGKRDIDSHSNTWHHKRACLRCGPALQGQCIGPRICCGPGIGCYMNSHETEVCQTEDNNPIPCEILGDACGPHGDGHCVANGICCTDEKCSLDAVCEGSEHADLYNTSGISPWNHFLKQTMVSRKNDNPLLQVYINRLLESQAKK